MQLSHRYLSQVPDSVVPFHPETFTSGISLADAVSGVACGDVLGITS